MSINGWGLLWVLLATASAGSTTWAQNSPVITGVYTCVDAKGRKLTADRPIPECADREQQVLNPSGTVKTKIGPVLTALERAAQEQKAKKEAEEQGRLGDEKRRERALLIRYPNKGVHDQERAEALSQIAAVVTAASTRMEELGRQRISLDTEMEFYKKDPSKAPAYLRRQLEENTQSHGVQKRFIAEQEAEAQRVKARFDDELARLRQLWTTVSK